MAKGLILFIDDEDLFLRAMEREITDAGYECVSADSGAKALRLVEERAFDIVFVDLVMPKMNGVEVCRQIRRLRPETAVVLISGHPKQIEEYLAEFLSIGGRDEMLRKPLFENEVLAVIEKLLREKNF